MAETDGAITPAGTSEPPRSRWRLGRFAVACGLLVSSIVHLGLVGSVLFVSPRLGHPEVVASVPVDLVTPDEIASAARSKPDQTPQQPTSPDPQTRTAAAMSQPSPALDAYQLPLSPAPAQTAPPAPPSGQAAQLARLIGLPVDGGSGGGPSEYQANLTADEIAAFAAHVQGCWTAPAGPAGAPTLNVVIRVSLRRDGGLMGDPVLIAAPASTQGPALVQSAMRALVKCQPYGGLPAAKYGEWRLLDLHFSPGGVSTATPVPGARHAPS